MGDALKNVVKQTIATNLRYYRKKRNLTQKALAEALGVRHNSVSSWETGINSIDAETLAKVCGILEVSLEEMYGNPVYGAYMPVITDREKLLILQYRKHIEMQAAVDLLLRMDVHGRED